MAQWLSPGPGNQDIRGSIPIGGIPNRQSYNQKNLGHSENIKREKLLQSICIVAPPLSLGAGDKKRDNKDFATKQHYSPGKL